MATRPTLRTVYGVSIGRDVEKICKRLTLDHGEDDSSELRVCCRLDLKSLDLEVVIDDFQLPRLAMWAGGKERLRFKHVTTRPK
jgi:hypothetical protein